MHANTLWIAIAELASRRVPFDRMCVAAPVAGSAVRLLAVADSNVEDRLVSRSDFSPSLWPERCGVVGEDALDLEHSEDRELHRAGFRSFLRGPLETEGEVPGAFWLASRGAVVATAADELPPEGVDLEAVERDLVRRALKQAGDNKSKAARLLRLTRAQLYSRIEKHGL